MKETTMEKPVRKLTRNERLTKSILDKREKHGLKAELTLEEREHVVREMREK